MTLPSPWHLILRASLVTLTMTMKLCTTEWTCPSRLQMVTLLMVRSPSDF